MRLEHARWPDLPALAGRIFVFPLGSLEQHGKHLPVFTDSMIIKDVADRVDEFRSDEIVLLPVQWLGHWPHHRRFGCVTTDLMQSWEMMRGVCLTVVRIWPRRIRLLNG